MSDEDTGKLDIQEKAVMQDVNNDVGGKAKKKKNKKKKGKNAPPQDTVDAEIKDHVIVEGGDEVTPQEPKIIAQEEKVITEEGCLDD